MIFTHRAIAIGLAVIVFRVSIFAYAPLGHQIVGGIADERLANTPTAAKVHALLNGLTLEKAALIADEIKGWDKNGVDDPRSFHYSADRAIDRQLRDFWRANQPTQQNLSMPMPSGLGFQPIRIGKDADATTAPSHHWFHYTDVPLVPPQRYRDGTIGRSKWDIVHMIPFCIDVLQGRIPEQNQRKITKPIALILLAHYVADIHQPLHVGAEYFDQQGRPTDPASNPSALPDEGGNTITLELADEPPRRRGIRKKKFHGFWDYDAVNALFPQVAATLRKQELEAQIEPLNKDLVHDMATHDPHNWQMPTNVSIDSYAEMWADEILPIAREAHARLEFRNVKPFLDAARFVAMGEAIEKAGASHTLYRVWATSVVREELHKAGWRLADLLAKIL